MNAMIPFNKPYLTGDELTYISNAVYKNGHISGNGVYTRSCHALFQSRYGFNKVLLTTSCTDALEMCALLLDIKPGDEVIVPSYTFVSTALAFVRQGAKIVFCDSRSDHPGIDENKIEELITSRTKVILPVHYAGVACDMNKIMSLANKYNVWVVEDAAQAIDSYYKSKPLGSIGHFGCFSFHETKNIQCGEGGLLAINDSSFVKRAEVIWEKGTNRAEFFRGEVNKYGWVDTGSSFLPSDILAAFLLAQLESLDRIQNKRKKIWEQYYKKLKPLAVKNKFELAFIPNYACNNGHMFYIKCSSVIERTSLIKFLKQNNIYCVFHYLGLHKSPYYSGKFYSRNLINADIYENCLLRLPFFYELEEEHIDFITCKLEEFYNM